jgi:hypothetical protein
MVLLLVRAPSETETQRIWSDGRELSFAQFLVSALRSIDLVGRVGEFEYAVCMPNTDEQGAAAAVQRIMELEGQSSLSINAALCPRDGEDLASLLWRCEHPVETITPLPELVSEVVPNRYSEIVQRLTTEMSGALQLEEGESARTAKLRLRRASKRLGVELEIWEEAGLIHFQRVDAPNQLEVA